jgi:hypothetical protein
MQTDVESVARRCIDRARDLSSEADLMQVHLDALMAVEAEEYARWDADKNDGSQFRVRQFMEQRDDTRRRLKMTREDAEHYLQCAAHLKGNQNGN